MCESPLISFRCALTLFWHSERPNVGETTVICDLGTSTVRFSVHAKMLTMSNMYLFRFYITTSSRLLVVMVIPYITIACIVIIVH